MTRVGLLGDTHMNGVWTENAIRVFQTEGITKVLQVGDFGLYGSQHGQMFLKRVNNALKKAGIVLYVTPGNHEDYDYIESIPVEEDGWQHVRSNILLAPRGLRWEWEGVSFVSLGGAPSVDRWYRTNILKGKHWWAQEALTDADVEKVVEGGTADVMVTHDAPLGVHGIESRIVNNPFGFTDDDLAYAYQGRVRMSTAFRAVQPKVFLHGHYHFLVSETHQEPFAPFTRGIMFSTDILGLDCDSHNHSLGELNLETKTATAWDRGVVGY